MGAAIDLNADVGEGMATDAELIPRMTSVNVACGAHAGDEATMREAIRLAIAGGAAVGAHPGYPDRAGFGRRTIAMRPDELATVVAGQVEALAAVARRAGATVTHVKPHGALYHDLAGDTDAARAVALAVARLDPRLRLVAPPGSALLRAASEAGLAASVEGFADRVYEPDGRLRSRDLPGALNEEPAAAAAQAVSIARDGRATARDGTLVDVPAATICVHGDTPGAPAIAAAVRAALEAAGISVRAPDAPDAPGG